MEKMNRLILVGNGFDLAHGLKTSYKNFIDWYMCQAFETFLKERRYGDKLVEIKNKYTGQTTIYQRAPSNLNDVLDFISVNDSQSIDYPSNFMRRLVNSFQVNSWVDIERDYFRLLKSYFSNPHWENKRETVAQLNVEFDFLVIKLAEYIRIINDSI